MLNVVALAMLGGMSDLGVATRLELVVVMCLNLACLASRASLAGGAARVGAAASLTGYLAAVALWIVLAIGCGIEYFNPRCDAVVMPLIWLAVALGLGSLPVGRLIDVIGRVFQR